MFPTSKLPKYIGNELVTSTLPLECYSAPAPSHHHLTIPPVLATSAHRPDAFIVPNLADKKVSKAFSVHRYPLHLAQALIYLRTPPGGFTNKKSWHGREKTWITDHLGTTSQWDETKQYLNPWEAGPRCIIYIFREYVLPGFILGRQLLTRASFVRHKACTHARFHLSNKHGDLLGSKYYAKCNGCFHTWGKHRDLRSWQDQRCSQAWWLYLCCWVLVGQWRDLGVILM